MKAATKSHPSQVVASQSLGYVVQELLASTGPVRFDGPRKARLLEWLLELERSRTAIYQAKTGLAQVNGGL